MRTPRPKPNKLHDELDALLDGRPVELTDELAPLAEVADALRAELAGYRLDPRVADRHLERVLDGAAPVVRLPVRPQPHGWDLRRRVAAVALAAALVLAPATMASAAALPGQAMYPFKLAIEELRIAAVQWSPGREAVERTRVADTRRKEVVQLADLKLFTQLPMAIDALTKAVVEAQAAVNDAKEDGKLPASVQQRLTGVAVASTLAVRHAYVAAATASVLVPKGTLSAITKAVGQAADVLPAPEAAPSVATPTPATTAAQPPQGPASTTAATQPPGAVVSPTQPPPTPAPSTTEAPTTTTTTTQPPTTTTAPESTDTSGSATGGTGGDDDQAGLDGQSDDQAVPTTTAPPGP